MVLDLSMAADFTPFLIFVNMQAGDPKYNERILSLRNPPTGADSSNQ